MEDKDFINCSNCNLPIYPPKLPKGKNVKDRFDQIRCLACNTLNSYTQSQEVISYPSTKSEWKLTIWGYLLIGGLVFGIILELLEIMIFDLNPIITYGLLITGLLILLYKLFLDLFKKN